MPDTLRSVFSSAPSVPREPLVRCLRVRSFQSIPLFLITFIFLACASQDAARNTTPQEMSALDAFTYLQQNQINAGWNLGNSLDAHDKGEASETVWGNPPINPAIINGVKEAGFDIIRIPITWMGYIAGPPNYRVSTTRLRRAAQVVDMAHNAGLVVIINLHHDGSTDNASNEPGWLSIRRSIRNEKDRERITAQFSRLWEQIAEYFKDYGDWLIFESFNELHDGGWGWSDAFKTASGASAQMDLLNEWNQIFSDKVRATGGNNASRYLMFPSYASNYGASYPSGKIKFDHPVKDVGGYFKLPADTVEGRQIVTVHYYDPYDFGIGGTLSSWGSDADRQRTDDDFRPIWEAYITKGIPVIIGECGAVRQQYSGNPEKEEEARLSRREYLAHIFATAKKYSMIPIYWDNGAVTGNGEKSGLLNRSNGRPNSEESAYLLKAMIDAAKGEY